MGTLKFITAIMILIVQRIMTRRRRVLLSCIAVSVQYSRMRHLWRHLAFSGLCNIVVCTTYNFLQKPAIAQKFKMADLNDFHIFKWHNILHRLSQGL